MGTNTLNVPAFRWVFGCSAVSGAMIAGYYDRSGYSNMYTGPTNGGVMPLIEDPSWGSWTDSVGASYPNNPLIASRNGLDGRTSFGSIDDYWVSYLSGGDDPYITGSWTQHAWGDAIGDYMKTSQSAYDNVDGATSFYSFNSATPLTCSDMVFHGIQTMDGTYGRKLFYEAKGYTVTDCYAQKTDNKITGGFSFAQYKAEIDAGRPVLLNLEGHSIVGVGYDDSSNTVYIHDTWDNNDHSMTWGGSYSGMALWGVSIVNLQASTPGVPDISVSHNPYNFGNVVIFSTHTQTFSVSNTGTEDLIIGSITIDGAQASEFSLNGDNCSGQTLAPSGVCTLAVTFTPTTLGAQSALLEIPSSDPDSPTVQVSLSGTGAILDIDVSPAALTFGNIFVEETSVAQTVTITNTGTMPTTVIYDITGTSPAMFAVAPGGCANEIVPGAACTLAVTFTPSEHGAQSAILEIASSDPDSPTVQVSLSGTGVYEATPSLLEGTYGTEITYSGAPSGFGTKKGKVYIGGLKQKVDSWTPTSITVIVNKVRDLLHDTDYDVSIQPKPKGTPTIDLPGAFTLRKPEISPVNTDSGQPEDDITINGMWFGTRKGKVYVGDQKCKVKSWKMIDPTTGESTITFVVHKKITAGTYGLEVENKVGRSLPFSFTVK